ncbi:MAG: tetratricopeptide repeat protein [Lewinellaceae bacterium]|nr:tetratricopeptide repeat protein [Lewinellaceae bacterium]
MSKSFATLILPLMLFWFACSNDKTAPQQSIEPLQPSEYPIIPVAIQESKPVGAPPGIAASRKEKQAYLQRLFNRSLWKVFEEQFVGHQRPTIVLEDRYGNGASYDPDINRIIFEKKAYDALLQLGARDFESVVVFIFYHELGHFLKGVKTESNFLKSFLAVDYERSDEEFADTFGAFLAYLAGYDLSGVLQPAIGVLYDAYQLDSVRMEKEGYLPRYKRESMAEETEKTLNHLVILFKLGNLLSAAGAYEEAAQVFEIVAKSYPGKEIHNNAGVNYFLWTLQYSGDTLSYPVEQSWQTRLLEQRKVNPIEGAKRHFKEAIIRDKQWISPRLNLACIFAYEGNVQAMEQQIKAVRQLAGGLLSDRDSALAQMITGLALAKNGDKDIAKTYFEALKTTDDPFIRELAASNLSVLTMGKRALPEQNLSGKFLLSRPKEDICNHIKNPQGEIIFSDEKSSIIADIHKRSSVTVFISPGDGVVIQHMKGNPLGKKRSADLLRRGGIKILTDEGFIIIFPSQNTGFLFRKNRLEEWFRYCIHKP